jgi:ABC-type sugar transport system ATPase subunit
VEKLDIKVAHVGQQIQNLSGGNQQKVILARWLLTGCHVLILDEPTRGIDVNAKAEIHHLLKDLVKEGISIIFISSELQEVIDIADRILIMHEGHLKGEVPAHRTNQEDVLRIALS